MVKMVDLTNGHEYVWDQNTFVNRKYIMLDHYQNFVDGDRNWQVPKVDSLYSFLAIIKVQSRVRCCVCESMCARMCVCFKFCAHGLIYALVANWRLGDALIVTLYKAKCLLRIYDNVTALSCFNFVGCDCASGRVTRFIIAVLTYRYALLHV